MYFSDREEEEQKLRKKKAIEPKTFNAIIDLLTANAFTEYELLSLIKYLLDRYPYPLESLPAAFLEALLNAPARQR